MFGTPGSGSATQSSEQSNGGTSGAPGGNRAKSKAVQALERDWTSGAFSIV